MHTRCLKKVLRDLCSTTSISNSVSVAEVFSRIDHICHWYVGEGLEEGEICEAHEDLATLENDYEKVGVECAKGDDGRW
ncbi:hypothetical protein MKW92_042130 [Papaver armeniacum]|nr:hypothetical protein MKW92_042130 [Papaver armeniacum]